MRKLLLLLILLTSQAYSATVESIEFFGLKHVKESLVKKELLLKVGDRFDREKLKKSIRNLMNTHLFYSIKPELKFHNDKVDVKLLFRERYSLIPLPKFRLKSDGSVRAGFEIRDYNFRGRGDRASLLFQKWFGKESDRGSKASVNFLFYRIWDNTYNLITGVDYSNSYNHELYEDGKLKSKYDFKEFGLRLGVQRYLDPYKIKSIYVGINPKWEDYSIKSGEHIDDRSQNYIILSFKHDLTTDEVYYVKGSVFGIDLSYAEPIASDTSTGTVTGYFRKYMHFFREDNLIISLYGGTKVGYSGNGFELEAGIPGYSSKRQTGRRYLKTFVKYRVNLLNRYLFIAPSVVAGDGFNNLPDDLLLSFGVEVEAFWARLSDGIIRFKVYRGTGRTSRTRTFFKLGFRW